MTPPTERSVHRFIGKENTFLQRVSPDHIRAVKEIDTTLAEFLERLAEEFFHRFPYRHVRYIDHFDHTEEEQEGCLYGKPLWGLSEMNDIKSKSVGKGKASKVPVPKPSGLMETRETTAYWRKRLAGQGYLTAGEKSPYTRDEAFKDLTERVASRLAMYPSVDFGAYTDDDRKRTLRDLPGDLDALVSVLAGHTGAEICILAGWRNEKDRLSVYSAASSHSRKWLTSDIEVDFANFQLENNGQLLTFHVRNAPPRVYGAFDGSFRPWFPSITKNCDCVVALLVEYIKYYALFQGITSMIAWEDGTEDREDSTRLINPKRLPAQVTHLIHPENMTNDQIWALIAYIIAGQRGLLTLQTVFQLLAGQPIEEDKFQIQWIRARGNLRFGPATRLYMARCIYRTEGDAQAHPLCQYSPTLTDLIEALWQYDEVGPISPPAGLYDLAADRCPHLPHANPNVHGFLGHFKSMWLIEDFWVKTTLFHKESSYENLSFFIRSDIFEHEPTGTLMSGPFAAKWLVLIIVRAEISWQQLRRNEMPPYRDVILPDLAKWRLNIDSDILYLTSRFRDSRRTISQLRATCPQDVAPCDITAEYRRAKVHAGPTPVEDTSYDGSSVVYNQSTTHSSSGAQKPKGRVVEIVMPTRPANPPRDKPSTAANKPIVIDDSGPESEDHAGPAPQSPKPPVTSHDARAAATPGPSTQRFARRDSPMDVEDPDEKMWTDEETVGVPDKPTTPPRARVRSPHSSTSPRRTEFYRAPGSVVKRR
ncbi:hypothetical protein FRC08_006302 [Ceratobasidium sp. 394]|nr:hypothetical protein FRC08_006302 [Ceratobasidium sp. 394]